MREKIFPALFVCLFLVFTVRAQGDFSINEAETVAVLSENQLRFSLVSVNSNENFSARVKLELVSPDDKIIVRKNFTETIKSGRSTLSATLSLDDNLASDAELLWYRLRYDIDRADNSRRTGGLISLSSVLPEKFDLRVALPQVRGKMRYAARVESFNIAGGKPVSDVQIAGEIKLKDGSSIKGATRTDADGLSLLEFDLPQIAPSEEAEITISGTKNGFTREITEELFISSFDIAHIQTDKALYQPDQTLNLRLLYIDQLSKPVTEANLNVEIFKKDADEEIVYRRLLKTSRFGLSSLSWKIPESARLGLYQIAVKNESGDVIGVEEIKITRYELPQFAVEAKTDRDYYLPEQKTARLRVFAQYLFGKPVAAGKVRITENHNRNDDEDKTKEITGELGADGQFIADIDLTEARRDFIADETRQFQDLQFTAFVTDAANNRTESKKFDIRISENPIHIYLIDESGAKSSRLPLKNFVSTFYPDGSPAECEVTIYRREEKQIGEETYAETGEILATTKTNALGAGVVYLPVPFETDELKMLIVARSRKGETGKIEPEIDYNDDPALQIETDKTLYRAGEKVKVSVLSSEKTGRVFVDVLKKGEILQTRQVILASGRAEFELPFQSNFKNHLTIAAYFENDDETVSAVRSVFFPSPQNLSVEAKIEKTTYRPGADVSVKLNSRKGANDSAETAFGVLVLDQALEERARAESEFDEDAQNLDRKFHTSLTALLGLKKGFGNLTYRALENLNMRKSPSAEIQLAAEIALQETEYQINFERSASLRSRAETIFDSFFRNRLKPVEDALRRAFEEKSVYPTNAENLQKIMLGAGIDFQSLRDPWDNPLQAEFQVNRDELVLDIRSYGADETPNTEDDLSVSKTIRKYFSPVGKKLEETFLEYTQRTGFYIVDYKILRAEALKKGLNLDELRDAFGNPYIFDFSTDRTYFVLSVRSKGANGIAESENNADDFPVFNNRSDFHAVIRANTVRALNEYISANQFLPEDEKEFAEILNKSGFDLTKETDYLGRSFYITRRENKRFKEVWRAGENIFRAVRQKISIFSINSSGADGIRGNFDDFAVLNFQGITGEEEAEIKRGNSAISRRYISSPFGAVSGYLTDMTGAVIPGAVVKTQNSETGQIYQTKTDDNGTYHFSNLPQGIYSLEFNSPGFQVTTITGVNVQPGVLMQIDIELQVGNVSSVVEVTAESVVIDTTDSSVQTSVDRAAVAQPERQKFTPRVRKYFPETLFWSPELISDTKGNAEVKFKLADSLTTWKFYAVGSTESGEYGLVEKDLQTFQPFFLDLDPPRILTAGDKISMPVTIRNYTAKKQKTNVTMTKSDWLTPLNSPNQTVEIAPNETKNAIFDFRAENVAENAVQKVSAIVGAESDAVEKPVTVKPNGREITEKQSAFFQNSTEFQVGFPADALAQGRRAELKIYPNMLAHVAESVDGLLERPHGCGEQTTSSTYPNLLILKIEKNFKSKVDENIKVQALRNLSDGYKRLLNYQTDTGFGYWSGSSPDPALTAYALRFLHDAKDFITVDEAVIVKAEDWILSRQNADGSWSTNSVNAHILTAYIARSLALTAEKDSAKKQSLERAVGFLKSHLPEITDDFVLANLGLTALEIGDAKTAESVAEKLVIKNDWTTASTPFNGWGTPAKIETTALVLQLILKIQNQNPSTKNLISNTLLFILKNKDAHGVWHSTQTTVNVLTALVLVQQSFRNENQPPQTAEIFVNNRKVKEFAVDENDLKNPLSLDIKEFLNQSENKIEIKGLGDANPTLAQIVSAHYVDWNNVPKDNDKYFDFKVNFDRHQARIGEEIVCSVSFRQKEYARGMVLLEIGLPPGADVDRASLEFAKRSSELSSYDVLPEKIVIYAWAKPDVKNFNFKFKPRFGIDAQTMPSVIYDYYNDEAKSVVAPVVFTIK